MTKPAQLRLVGLVETSGIVEPSEFRSWIRAGEARRAGDWLVRRFTGEVLGLCMAMVRDRTAAEDLTQEVFGKAFAGLDGFRGDASVRTWVLSIARNRCIDHLRAQKRDPWRGRDMEPPDPDEQPAETPLPPDLMIRRAEVEGALAELSEGERAIIVLRFQHGLGYSELAAAFGLKEGTVRMRVSRALRRMRSALEQPLMGGAPESMAASFEMGAAAEPAGGAPSPVAGPPPRRSRAASASAPPPAGAIPLAAAAPARRGILDRILRRGAPSPQSPAPVSPPPAAPPPSSHALAAFFADADASAGPEAGLVARLDALVAKL